MRPFPEVRSSVIESLLEFFTERMSFDSTVLDALRPLLKFDKIYNPTEIERCHYTIASDYGLREFAVVYKDFARNNELKG